MARNVFSICKVVIPLTLVVAVIVYLCVPSTSPVINGRKSTVIDNIGDFKDRKTYSPAKVTHHNDVDVKVKVGPRQRLNGAANVGPSTLPDKVHVVPSTLPDKAHVSRQNCVPLPSSPRRGVLLCVYPARDDIAVSAAIHRKRLYEGEDIKAMASFIKYNHTDMQLLDIGANVGVFTVFFAAMDCNVLSVEMLPANIRLIQRSLTLNDLGHKVTLVQNGLWSEHTTLQVHKTLKNVGMSLIQKEVESDPKMTNVSTVCMDDLVPLVTSRSVIIKMDIEKAEDDALLCAETFFTEVDVRVVLVEWKHQVGHGDHVILEFMRRHGFTASFSPLTVKPIDMTKYDVEKDSKNVYFVKL